MKKLYFFSGLGADRSTFNRLKLYQAFEYVYVDWLIPEKKESLSSYCTRLIEKYHIIKGQIYIGLSFGGIIASEIDKQQKADLIILISSISQRSEKPPYLKFVNFFKLNYLIPKKQLTKSNIIIHNKMGAESELDKKRLNSILEKSDYLFTRWAINKMVSWRNNIIPDNIIRINGDKDKVFPLKNINSQYIIKGGTHFIVWNRANELSEIINKYLSQYVSY